MTAAQACSNQRYTWHHSPEESKAAIDAGYPYGFGITYCYMFVGIPNSVNFYA